MTEEKIKSLCYTKEEVDLMIEAAVAEARAIDEESMRKHNRDATIISMILGFTCLALFLDGTLRLLGIIPPFLDIDISIVDKIAEKVETEVLPLVQKIPRF
mgnify:CR=1 FL=1|tara:strand:+ start:2465 stop:2767 length:303 start_codon:yes stop_codon:yes gene_type:complete